MVNNFIQIFYIKVEHTYFVCLHMICVGENEISYVKEAFLSFLPALKF